MLASHAVHRSTLTVTLVRWAARVSSLASIGLLIAFAMGPQPMPTAREWVLIAFFPIGVVVGMAVGWWRELLGGVVSLSSLACFYAALAMGAGMPKSPYAWNFAILASPAVLFVVCGILSRGKRG